MCAARYARIPFFEIMAQNEGVVFMRACKVLSFGFTAALVFTTTAPATEFQAFGGVGASAYREVCTKGEYLVGMSYRSGSWMDQIAIICKKLESDGRWGATSYNRKNGGNGGVEAEKLCADRENIRTMQAPTTRDDTKVLSILFGCFQFGENGQPAGVGFPIQIGTYSEKAASKHYRPTQVCPDGEAATGVYGNDGQYINSIGLICGKFIVPTRFVPPRDPAKEAAAEAARRKQREFEIQVTGRTADVCMQASNACQARLRAQLGPVYSDRVIASECLPYQQQCLAHAAADAAKKTGATTPPAPPPTPPPTGGQTATGVNSTDVYPNNSGNSEALCTMNPGDTGKFLSAKADEVRWIRLSGISGECGGKSGWVWQGDNREDVSLK
jgi:hypothetical protein